MVPGILVMLVTIIGSSFAANNIVREKEMGTIEQINVSPIKKTQFILGKLIPFWMLALTVLTMGLLIARFVYGIVPRGALYHHLYFCINLPACYSRVGFADVNLCTNATAIHAGIIFYHNDF